MASTIVHLAITNELTKRISFADTSRLKFGAIVADFGTDGNQNGSSHLKVDVLDSRKRTYDFDRFREMFGTRILSDDLYMGYYLHLVQDSLYRRFVYDGYHWNPSLPGNVERLHNDYRIVNQYIISRYRLENDIAIPDGFDREDLNQICSFDTAGLIKSLDGFFLPVREEPVFFFTREMSDEFIGEALVFCYEEVEKLRKGETGIDMLEYAWNRVN